MHRDIKPTNILLDTNGRACVGDFGLAHVMQGRQRSLTLGAMAGTPEYMSPEHALGKETDRRSDIYSLGVVAYEMLTGHVLFSAPEPMATLLMHVNDPVPVPSREEVPRQLFRSVQMALAKRPDDRWPSARAFVDAFERSASSSIVTLPRTARVAAWAGAVLGLAAIAMFAARRAPLEPAGPVSQPAVEVVQQHGTEPITPPAAPPQDRSTVPASPKAAARNQVDRGARRSVSTPSSASLGQVSAPRAVEERGTADRLDAPTQAEDRPAGVSRNESVPATQRVSADGNDMPTTPAPTTPIDASDVVTSPVRITTVQPSYPAVALSAGIDGEVVLQAVIGPDGKVTSVEVVRSAHPLLDEAAKRAVVQYRYKPALKNGAPVSFTLRIPVLFKLQ